MKQQIKDYEGRYQIDEHGIVYSTPKDGKPNRILKQYTVKRNHTNYKTVRLSKEGKVKDYSVHRLVAETFIPNTNNRCCVNHKDNDGTNNIVTNLEWSTHNENMEHSEKQGRQLNSHTLGGIALGKQKTDKAKIRYDALVGKTFKNRKLLKIISYGKHPKATFECLKCDKIFDADIASSLKLQGYLACRSCGLRHRHKNKIKI